MPTLPIPDQYRNDPNIIFAHPRHTEPDSRLEPSPAQPTLDRINHAIGSSGESLETIIHVVFTETRDLFTCDRIGLAFLTDNNERVTAYTAASEYQPLLLKSGYSEDLQGSSLEYILKSGKTRIIEDLELYAKKFPQSRSTRILLEEGVRSNMTSPLMVDDRIVGLLFRSSRQPKAYQMQHVHTNLVLADRLSQIVEKAYRIEQLKTAMNNYTEMLGFVSHEIKSPLSTIIMDCRMMLDGYLGEINPRVTQRIKRIVERGDYLLGMVRDYLDLARIEGGELTLRAIAAIDFFPDIVEYAADMHQSLLQENNQVLHLNPPDSPVIINGDLNLLRIVVVNLLSNAIKYGNNGGRIEVVVQAVPEGMQLTVKNEGPGIPASEMPKLFRKFSRVQTPELLRRKGTGVGLYTVWRILKLHGGRIRAESEEGKWAMFRIDLPCSSHK
ncbi:GAF domain-containing sensor histidine kinase [bacterium]|nr:GAF domain-containing sensor histidine kinase [candidate division CSSED10-310 bacterium]